MNWSYFQAKTGDSYSMHAQMHSRLKIKKAGREQDKARGRRKEEQKGKQSRNKERYGRQDVMERVVCQLCADPRQNRYMWSPQTPGLQHKNIINKNQWRHAACMCSIGLWVTNTLSSTGEKHPYGCCTENKLCLAKCYRDRTAAICIKNQPIWFQVGLIHPSIYYLLTTV